MPELQRLRPQGIHLRESHSTSRGYAGLRLRAEPLTCGSGKIKRVRRDWTDEAGGARYTVPALEFYECPSCGERVYDREARGEIEASRPALREKANKEQPPHP